MEIFDEKEKEEQRKYLEHSLESLNDEIKFLKNQIKFMKKNVGLDEKKLEEKLKECILGLVQCTAE